MAGKRTVALVLNDGLEGLDTAELLEGPTDLGICTVRTPHDDKTFKVSAALVYELKQVSVRLIDGRAVRVLMSVGIGQEVE